MSNNNNNKKTTTKDATAELKRQLETLQNKVNKLTTRNKNLEDRCDIIENKNSKLEEKIEALESKLAISEIVTDKLSNELDRLDQYHRRNNVMLKNINLNEDESQEDLKEIVFGVLKDEMNLDDNIIKDIDKFHRSGFVKKYNDSKKQNIIIRFKSHKSRYSCLEKKKNAKSGTLSPNLTKKRGKILYDASNIIKEKKIDSIAFVFANYHGDLQVRLAAPYENKQVFPFNSLKELDDFLLERHLISESQFC